MSWMRRSLLVPEIWGNLVTNVQKTVTPRLNSKCSKLAILSFVVLAFLHDVADLSGQLERLIRTNITWEPAYIIYFFYVFQHRSSRAPVVELRPIVDDYMLHENLRINKHRLLCNTCGILQFMHDPELCQHTETGQQLDLGRVPSFHGRVNQGAPTGSVGSL